MNVESILEKISLFNELVIDSGLKRNVTDYYNSIQQSQNRNLIFMKDISNKLKTSFTTIEDNLLDSELKIVLKDSIPFTELEIKERLEKLDNNNEIAANVYFQEFNKLLQELNQNIALNEEEVNKIYDIFSKYTSDIETYKTEAEQALVSLIFKDLKSTKSLKDFAKVLNKWSKTLLIYHTLLKSDSPSEISLMGIQNGSIDVIFNIDVDIAINLVDLLEVGLKAFGAYLLYKSDLASQIIDTFMGNKQLLKLEEQRESLLLENIKDSVKTKLLEQHKLHIKTDKKISKEGFDKKIDLVSSVITEHIINGNEFKLLSIPHKEDDSESEEVEIYEDLSSNLREETSKVRHKYKNLNPQDKQFLLEKFSIKDDEK